MKTSPLPEQQNSTIHVVLISIAGVLSFISASLSCVVLVAWAVWQKESLKTPFERLSTALGKNVVIWAPLAVYVIAVAVRKPIAPDDLLRDIVSWRYGFDYRKLFPISDLPSFDLWVGFDHALALLNQWLPDIVVMWTVQFAAFALFSVVLVAIGRHILPDTPDRPFWIAIAVVISLSPSSMRLICGRPEIFMTVWMLTAVLVNSPRRMAAWVGVGCLVSTGYWLAPIYFIGAILSKTSKLAKVGAIALLSTFHIAFWQVYSDGRYFDALVWLKRAMTACPVGENVTILVAIMNPVIGALIAALIFGFVSRPKVVAWPAIFVLLFFLLADQARYVDVVAPLAVILLMTLWADRLPGLNAYWRAGIMVACLYTTVSASGVAPSIDDAPRFMVPPNSRVFAAESGQYALSFFNAGKIQVEPSFAFGAAPPDLLSLMKDQSAGSTNCDTLHRYQFTHLVEKMLVGPPPACLTLEATQKGWRLWRIN